MADQKDDDVCEGEDYNPEEEIQSGDWKVAQVNLPEIPTLTGEEQEDELTKFRAKLYRWKDGEWKERGLGDLRLLKHKQTNKIRVLMRQDKTHKLVANFYVQGQAPLCALTPQKTTDKAWVFSCCDNSEEQPMVEKLCTRFTSVDEFKRFQTEFENALKSNNELNSKSGEQQVQNLQENKEVSNTEQVVQNPEQAPEVVQQKE